MLKTRSGEFGKMAVSVGRKLTGAALIIATIGLSGCIRSRVTITSDPPQAEVTFRGKPRGVTPITIPFIWYWHYDVAVEKEGYEKVEVLERFRTPPWFLMPLDIFAEIIPVPIPDQRYRHYVLTKKKRHPDLVRPSWARRRLRISLLAAGVLLSCTIFFAAAAESSSPGEIGDAVVARVNGSPVLLSDLRDSALDQSIPISALTFDGLHGEGFRKAVTARVDEMLLVEAAKKQELTVDDVEVSRRVERYLRRLEDRMGGVDKFNEFLANSHLGAQSLRRMLTEREKRGDLATSVVARRISINNADIMEFRKRREDEGKQSDEVQLAQILIKCPKDEQKTAMGDQLYQRALRITREVGKDPARFPEIAKRESDDPAGREIGGLLGWIDPRVLVPPLPQRVATMRPNEVTEPVASDLGYHVLLLIDRHTSRDLLFAERFEQERTKLLETLRAKATIEIYPLNRGSGTAGN